MPPRAPKQPPNQQHQNQQHQPQRLRPVVCIPECVHGTCGAADAKSPERATPTVSSSRDQVEPELGLCRCKDGYTGKACETVSCPTKCVAAHGQCITPDICSCAAGWSGQNCDVAGTVTYGAVANHTLLQLHPAPTTPCSAELSGGPCEHTLPHHLCARHRPTTSSPLAVGRR